VHINFLSRDCLKFDSTSSPLPLNISEYFQTAREALVRAGRTIMRVFRLAQPPENGLDIRSRIFHYLFHHLFSSSFPFFPFLYACGGEQLCMLLPRYFVKSGKREGGKKRGREGCWWRSTFINGSVGRAVAALYFVSFAKYVAFAKFMQRYPSYEARVRARVHVCARV